MLIGETKGILSIDKMPLVFYCINTESVHLDESFQGGEEVTVSIHEVSKYFSKQTGTVQVLENINFQLEKGFCYSNWSEWLRKKYTIKNYCRLRQRF